MLSFFKHSPYSTSPTKEKISRLEGRGTAGEMLSLSFSISAADSVSELLLTPTDLKSSNNFIQESCIGLFVVKVWEQAGIGVYQSSPLRVAELLLKDDREPLRDSYTRRGRCQHWRHVLRKATLYKPPDVRVEGAALTSLQTNEPKQIWVSVRIPNVTVPGVYGGHIQLQEKNQQSAQRLDLQVEVLPFKLLEADQDLFMWFKGTLDCNRPQHYLNTERFRAQLQDIYNHGFRSLSFNEYDSDQLQSAVDIADSIGFNRNILLTAPYPARFSKVNFRQLTPIYYISDEIDARSEAFTRDHIEQWHRIKNGGGQTMASLVHQPFAERLFDKKDIGCPPEILSYYLPANLTYFSARSKFPKLSERKTYYYWQSHMEKPDVHRVLAGVYLWKCKADGISPYCYQHLPQPPFSPFDDFDEWEPDGYRGSERLAFKDHMTTYPAVSGSIPTVQWKGLADGIFDLRYLTTLASTIKKSDACSSPAIQACIRESWGRVEQFLRRISLKDIDITSDKNSTPYKEIMTDEYSRFREQIADDILALNALAHYESRET
jgi:hypothetical protein